MTKLTDRQQALLGYFATIAFDEGVRAAFETRSLAKIGRAISKCIDEDLPTVAKAMLKQLRAVAEPRVKAKARGFAQSITTGTPRGFASSVERAFEDGVGAVIGVVDELLSGVGRSKTR